ncbi:1-acyl-sn-glycerol-3-phosphate acyltransferases [Ruminococcaceae bacterium YAD3003]|nr:1-acyl-sn-glycerol-3-phosphate acyltransferases [Ruminococcaceae bacterium YAD3003]
MFLIRWLLILNSIIPALIIFPIKKIYLRKDKKEKYKGPVIVSMNHTSFLDYIEALLAFPGRRMYVLVGAKFYAWNPFLTFLLKAMGVIKVDEVTGNMDAVNKAVEQINKGHSILIFPEGHIETEGKLMEYKQAAALISLSSGVPIVPVFHNGRIGPGKRDLMFVGSYMYPDTYMTRDDLDNLQDRAKAFTSDLQDRTEEYRQFYLRNFMIADGKKLKRPKYASFLYNFMKYTALPGIKCLMRTKITYGGDLARGTRYMDKGMIIVANHSWWIDSALLYFVFRRVYCRSLAAKDVAEVNKSWSYFERKMGCILLDRTGFDWNALKTMMDGLKNHEPIIIFPEGHMNYDDDLIEFQKGPAMLSLYTHRPVVPVYIHTSYKLFKPTRFVVGDPLEFDKAGLVTDNESYEIANEMMRESLYALKRQAINETKPKMNRYIKKVRKEMKENLAKISAEIEEARNAKASGN